MKKFEILEHTTDLKIRVFGRTKEELFLNALLAMENGLKAEIKNLYASRWIAEPYRQKPKTKNIKVKSIDFSTLLVDFLSQVLYLNQVNKEIYSDFKISQFSDREIEGKLIGQRAESFGEDIKAVTYHNLDVHQKKDGSWEATILFDI